MWSTLLTLWRTRSGKAPRKAVPRRRPAGCRPRLEVLEDRTTPAALGYSTYLHGIVQAVAVDQTGAVYVTGSTDSTLPTTPGAFQTSGSGAFVAKLNATGTGVVYATYLGNSPGGTGYAGYGIAVDAAGDAYVIGLNPNVPTTPNALASSGEVFVSELNPTGSALVYSTYLPGAVGFPTPGFTYGCPGAIAVDGSGNIYVAGAAQAGFPVTAGAYQTAYVGYAYNAFFAEINPALSGSASLVYSSYLGGNNKDAVSGIALDGSGGVYVTGFTLSHNFPTTSGAYQTAFLGREDSFVAKFNPALSGMPSLVYSTLLGGSVAGTAGWASTGYVADLTGGISTQVDQTNGGIAVDSAGNAYVTSATSALDFPTTSGAFQTQSNLQGQWTSDAFVTKLNPTGTALVYSTYLGGGTNTKSGGAGIALDANGDAYVTGWTNSTVFPTKNPLQATNAGGWDAFVTEVNPSGSGLLFSSYLGGSGNDDGYGIALDSSGNTYIGGRSLSANFPITPGAYETNYNPSGPAVGGGFVAKINAAPSFAVTGFSSPTTAGTAGTFTVTAQDANGNTLTGYTGTVHFTSSDPQAVLPADYTFTAADQGVHTFSATLKTAGSQSLVGTDTVTSGMSGQEGIVVNPAAATHFSISGPSSVRSGSAFSLTVTVLDAYGNVATGYTGTVKFTDSVSGATLPSNYTFTATDDGVHTFTGLKLKTKGKQTLTVMDTLNSSILATLTITVS
jgi:hypothetical protein